MLRSSEHRQHKQKWSWLLRSHDIPFSQNRPLHIMITVFVLLWALTAISPVEWKDWILENILLVLFIGAIAFLYRTFVFSNFSYLLILVFFLLHAIGAHYAYQHTPVDVWYKNIFHTNRGVYDRIVHLAFGLLIAYPILETTIRIMKLRSVWSYTVTFTVIMASAALFEIVEMLVTLLTDPQLAAEYLGYQGDPLDTQKDMSMSLLGVLIAIGVMIYFRYLRNPKQKS